MSGELKFPPPPKMVEVLCHLDGEWHTVHAFDRDGDQRVAWDPTDAQWKVDREVAEWHSSTVSGYVLRTKKYRIASREAARVAGLTSVTSAIEALEARVEYLEGEARASWEHINALHEAVPADSRADVA